MADEHGRAEAAEAAHGQPIAMPLEESQGDAEWEDRYEHDESQEQMEEDAVAAPSATREPEAAASPSPSLSVAAPGREEILLVDEDDEEHSQLVAEQSASPSQHVLRPPRPFPGIASSVASPALSDVAEAPAAVSRAEEIPLRLIEIVDLRHEEGDSDHLPSVKRRRIAIEEESAASQSSSAAYRPLRVRVPASLASLAEDVPLIPPIVAAPASPASLTESELLVPHDSSFLAYDFDAFVAALPAIPPSPPIPSPTPWAAPPPPYLPSDCMDSLPTFDLGPSSTRFPRDPRPVKPFTPNFRLLPLVAHASRGSLNAALSVRLFGESYEVSRVHLSLRLLFDELHCKLDWLHAAAASEQLTLATAESWTEQVHMFLSFCLSYVQDVLPKLPALDASVILHCVESALMASTHWLLVRRLPVYDVNSRSGRGVYCCALYAHLMAHSALLQLHGLLLSVAASLPLVSSVRAPWSSTVIALPSVGSRWSVQSYVFFLILDLLRLHQNHVALGSLPFAVYFSLPNSDVGHAQRDAEVKDVKQPVLTLWRDLIAYVDHLSEQRYREPQQPQQWTSEAGFVFCSSEEDELQRVLIDRFEQLRAAPQSLAEDDELAMAVDVPNVTEPFPSFYNLLNLTLESFVLDGALSSLSSPTPLLSIPVPPAPRSDLIQRCVQPQVGATPPLVARDIRDRVEVIWELLFDVILPCYSLPSKYPSHWTQPEQVALLASYSLYEGPSPPPLPPLTLLGLRGADEPQCACRPHWSLIYFLMHVGTAHVSNEWRHAYSTHLLDRLCCLIHVWPAIHLEPLMLSVHKLCGLDVEQPPRVALSQRGGELSLAALPHYPPFLLAERVHVPVLSEKAESSWCRYLQLLFIFLRMVAEAQQASSTTLFSQPLSHNNQHHHALLFHSATTNLHVISSFYLSFPKPRAVLSCADHQQLDAVVKVASLYLVASLVTGEEAKRAHIHLEKLIDWRASRCYHAHNLLLQCWASLLSVRIDTRMEMGEAATRFTELFRLAVQELLDEEEDIELLQCAVWNPPRGEAQAEQRERGDDLLARVQALQERRKRAVSNFTALRRLLTKKKEAQGFLASDCALLMGEAPGLTPSQVFQLDSHTIVLDVLRPERPAILRLRQQALQIVQLVVQSAYSIEGKPAHPPVDARCGAGSQDSDDAEMVDLLSELEEKRAEEGRLQHWPSFLRFLSTAHRVLLECIQAAAQHEQAALTLLNPHRASLVAKVALNGAELDRYKRGKKDNAASKAQYRRLGSKSIDDAYRYDRATLQTCIRLYADISHLLLSHSERLTPLTLVTSFGKVNTEQKQQQQAAQLSADGASAYLFRYLSLFLYDAFLSSKVRGAREWIDRVLSRESDRCCLIAGLIAAMLDPASWTSETMLGSLLPALLVHPSLRRYQQPPVDVSIQCATMELLAAHRGAVLARLLCGLGELYTSSASEQMRDLWPSLLHQLALQHDRIIQQSLAGGAHPEQPPELNAVQAAYIRFLYDFLTALCRHCLPMLHPRHSRDPIPLEGVLSSFFEQVLPTERAAASSSSSFVLHTPTCQLHQDAALSAWPHLLYGVSRLKVDPRGIVPAVSGRDDASIMLPLSIKALAAAVKHFWPGGACPDPALPSTRPPVKYPTAQLQYEYWRSLRVLMLTKAQPQPAAPPVLLTAAAAARPAAPSRPSTAQSAAAGSSRPPPTPLPWPAVPASAPLGVAVKAEATAVAKSEAIASPLSFSTPPGLINQRRLQLKAPESGPQHRRELSAAGKENQEHRL